MVLVLDGTGAQMGLVVYSSGAKVGLLGLVSDGNGAQVGLVCARLGVREFPRPALICHGWEGRHATSAYQPKLLEGQHTTKTERSNHKLFQSNIQPIPGKETSKYQFVFSNRWTLQEINLLNKVCFSNYWQQPKII